ncbi:hypothetical protein PP178_04175 [Zeaxanthinibacter sp. PT1]|uniref:hypothetical protein n=1 Tax=Zeaxanthinibacter TaxID=561554 RepID=UPI00234AEED1|nr:hypothetical protein [Zeaxanthinibacter sp. PT1]MDC6350738.1 hypothetical protein [Zeaxanthinibacter sp. PT1]
MTKEALRVITDPASVENTVFILKYVFNPKTGFSGTVDVHSTCRAARQHIRKLVATGDYVKDRFFIEKLVPSDTPETVEAN